MRIGVLSDTHGFLDPGIRPLFDGVSLILHAGDIGGEEVIHALEAIAPVVAVSGNGDYHLYHLYPWDREIEAAGSRIVLCHWFDNWGMLHPKILKRLREDPPDALVYGHTHEPVNRVVEGVLHLNPGYAGPPAPAKPRSVAILSAVGARLSATLHPLP